MFDECACLCVQAGHYGICKTVPEPALRLPARWTIVPGMPVCRACHDATRAAWQRGGTAELGAAG